MLDVVVVGAGLAGLEAARGLVAAGRSALVVEARDRVGGRVLSAPFAGDVIDLGAQWIGPTQDRVRALARELGASTFPQPTAGRRVLEHGGRVSAYSGTIPKMPLLSLIEAQLSMWRLDAAARRVPLDAPWRAASAERLDAFTVEAWQAERLWTKGARDLLTMAVQMVLCCEPRDLSFLWFLFYLHAGGGFRRLVEVEDGAQQDRVRGGMQQLATGLAARLGDRVRLSAPARAIEQQGDRVIVEVAGERSERIEARYVVLAVPPALAGRIEVRPALPESRRAVESQMPMGSIIKCVVGYPRAFWREQGFSGEVLSQEGPARAFFDDCLAGPEAALVGFIVGDDARRLGKEPAERRRDLVVAQLVRTFGGAAAAPSAYVDRDWRVEEWSAGCYVGNFPPGVLATHGEALRAPVGRIHYAGTESATRWAGYMEGALESGERAAREVLARLAPS